MDSSDVVVEEVDRRAAARLVGLPSTADDEIVDRDPAVQAFARHRIAAEQAQAARIASLEAQLEQARVEGVRMGIEAAARECWDVESPFDEHSHAPEDCAFSGATEACWAAIRALDPVAIAKECRNAG